MLLSKNLRVITTGRNEKEKKLVMYKHSPLRLSWLGTGTLGKICKEEKVERKRGRIRVLLTRW